MPAASHKYLQEFLDYLKYQKRYSHYTIVSYQTDLTAFFEFIALTFNIEVISDIKAPIIRSWLATLKEQGLESKSINRKISALKSFFKYQLRLQVIDTSPMTTVISPKVNKRLPQFVDKKDVETLFIHVEFPDDWKGRTDKIILELFYNTGIRQAELVNLKESQVDVFKSIIKVLGKGNKERLIPISQSLVEALKAYMAEKRQLLESPDTLFLLVNNKGIKLYPRYVYNVVNNYLKQVTTIDKKSPHVLRHTFATHLLNNGAEINAIKELLGHSSLAATQVYTHNTIDKLKDIYKKAHPRA